MAGAKGGASGGAGTNGAASGKGGATDAAGQAPAGAAGQPAAGSTGQPVSGEAGQAGAAGQPTGGDAGQPTGGAGETTTPPTTAPPATTPPTTVAPPATTPPTTVAPPATTPPKTTPATGAGSTIVPLYTSPDHASWNTVIAAKTAHPTVGVVAIVNPNNGPGSAVSSAYASGIARLIAAGIKVIGYVSTDYTRNSAATVKADIDRWKAFYPALAGIFFDEQSNQAGDVPYYRDLSQYAKSQGLSFTVGNPGTDTAESYIGALDMMLIYETAGLPSQSQLGGWHANHAPSNFGIIPYAAQLDATFVRNARANVGYIYIQNDNLPNPWDSVPSYFSDLLAALE